MMRIQINKYHIIYALTIIFLLTGCKVRRPKDVIPEAQMEDILYDYHIAKAMGDNLPYNENYKKALYIEYVFKKHNTDEATFDSSMVWYSRNASVLTKVYEKVTERLKAEQGQIDKLIAIRDNKPKISTPGDSIDVWFQERMLHLTGNPLNNKLAFIIPSDSNFKARDTLQWSVHYHFLDGIPDSIETAFMSLAIHYANDSIISQTKRVFEDGVQSIRLQADTLGDMKEIRGFIYYPRNRDSIIHLFADSISLMRYHSNDSLFQAKTDSLDKEPTPSKPEINKTEDKPVEIIQQQPERLNPDELRRRGERPRPVQRTPTETIHKTEVKETIGK